jgi:hypothetical protein
LIHSKDGELKAEIVKNSILIWPADGATPMQENRRGPKSKDRDEWMNVPDYIKKSGIAPDIHDYHGNFNTDLFEKIFKRVCLQLGEFKGCIFHMDGARYHFRNKNPAPKISWKRDRLVAWCEKNAGGLPELPEGKSKLLKKDLLDHAEKVKVRPDYPTVKIAARRRFTILKPPPTTVSYSPLRVSGE